MVFGWIICPTEIIVALYRYHYLHSANYIEGDTVDTFKQVLAGLFGSAIGFFFLAFGILSLPFNVITIMRLTGWEWWSALLASIFLVAIPIVGQLAYLIFAIMGAYYFVSAGFDWRQATNPLPVASAKPGDWPTPEKEAYIKRCTASLAQQGQSTAGQKCRCLADGMEKTFGKSRYLEMMAAQPNPKGTQADRELYTIMIRCVSN